MKSNYRPIGDFIELVDVRNKDLRVDHLLGLSITKEFIPSVANTVGTNMSNYKVIKKNQFACSIMQVRRDKKMPVALLKDFDEAIISQAYPVFQVVDEEVLSPDYLMMWFSRAEFDRHACFLAVGGVRGSLEWDDFLEMELPVPSIEKQREIVKEYNTIVNRIKLNEQLNQKLEETAQALYKHWFVDFEFPNENGQPYKSSGGEMIYNEELDQEIPEGWEQGNIESLCTIIDGDRGKNYPSQGDLTSTGFCLFLNAGNVTKHGFEFKNNSFISQEKDEILRKGKLERRDTILTTRGTVGNLAYYSDQIEFENLRINSGMVIMRSINKDHSLFLYSLMRSNYMKINIENYLSGSAQPQLPIKDIKKIIVVIPAQFIVNDFSVLNRSFQDCIEQKNKENRKLRVLKDLLLSRMTSIESLTFEQVI